MSCYSGLEFSGEDSQVPVTSPVPGVGFKTPECGKFVRKLRAGSKTRDIFHNCNRLTCPVCLSGALDQKARDAAERFEHYETLLLDINVPLVPGETRKKRPRHVPFTISPAHQAELVQRVRRSIEGPWTAKHDEAFLDLFREEFSEVLKASGLVGGMIVYHAYRVRHPATGATGSRAKLLLVREAKLARNMTDESKAWELYDHIRKQNVLKGDPEAWRDYYYFSPHFHVTGYGRMIPIDEFEQRFPGWTYHNKGDAESPGGLARYLFSHEPLFDERRSVSWFGRLSSKILGLDEIRTYEQEQFDEETGFPWLIVESVRPGEIGRIYTIPVTEYQAFFRKTRKKTGPREIKPLKIPGRKRTCAPVGIEENGNLAYLKREDGEVLFAKENKSSW